jgi:PAS domain S-box-containing protein
MEKPATILAVDDDFELLDFLAGLLKGAGYQVRTASSGEQALSIALADPPDLVLMDVRMDGMDGLETCRGLKANDVTRHAPIILMSAFATAEEWAEGIRSGGVDYISKPFKTTELLSRVKTHLDLHRATSRLEQIVEARTEELQQANMRLDALWSLSTLTDMDDKAIYDFILEKIVRMTRSGYGFFGLLDADEKVMTIHAWSGEAMKDCGMVDKPVEYRIDEVGIWGEAVRQRKPLIVNDYSAPHQARKGYPSGHVPLTRLMVVPTFSGGRIVTVAAVANKVDGYDDADLMQLTVFMDGVQLIMDRSTAMDELRKSEVKYHSVAEFTYDMETWRAPGGKFIYISPSCKRITGYSVAEYLANPGLALSTVLPEDRELLAAHYAQEGPDDQGEDRHVDFRFVTKDGKVRWMSHYCTEVVGEDGRSLGRRASNRDITDRKLDEERIEALLREKELLLHEVHHRIKNNMNSMASLLSLQSNMVRDKAAVDALNDARSRLLAMGVLYEKLYRSENPREMPVQAYILPLVEEIVQNFPARASVDIKSDFGDFTLEARVLQPLGIVINEIVTNSLKYAFEGKDSGTIDVTARMDGKRVTIALGDNGVGLPESTQLENSNGLGLMLIKGLMQQVDGSVRIERNGGTTFILEFERMEE